jgi:hypothetical protein
VVVNNTGVWSVLAGAKRVLSVCVLIIITQDIKSLAAVCVLRWCVRAAARTLFSVCGAVGLFSMRLLPEQSSGGGVKQGSIRRKPVGLVGYWSS